MKIHNLEQNSPEWFDIRIGKPSASNFKKIVTSKGDISKSMDEYATTLACQMYSGEYLDSFQGNYYTERGHELEPDARAWYEFMTNSTVEMVGFITDDSEIYGCSPDGLVGESGLLEIKCLKAENHVKAITRGTPPTDYIQQVKGQLMISEREWCDLLFYHPKLPNKYYRIFNDPEFNDLLLKGINVTLKKRDEVLIKLNGMK